MKINVPITAAVAAAAAAAGLALMPTAGADTTLGQQGRLTNGDVVQAWTISDLKVSTDQLPYQPKGTLWEATATDEAIQGSVSSRSSPTSTPRPTTARPTGCCTASRARRA
ncbi:immunogenic protein MPT63 [Mycobacteroides abscessus subsp. massiliense]|nr:immunogenic protein MPT63 [Mycobacteroides abscessus subsp. massiliense]